jgi:ribosomal protein S18 acetylase RimI-like enzyme
MGLRKVSLSTEFSNRRIISLFRKLGFSIKSTYGDECEMKLDLPADSEAKAA